MTFDQVLRFLIDHNEKIILLTIVSIGALSILTVYFQVFTNRQDSNVQLIPEIEKTLQKILTQTNSAIQTVAGSSAGGATGDVQALKKELETKAGLVEDLQKQVESAKKTASASPELLEKIKNLEGRLAEYEIIEDDIADLSIYKEENAKLKKELEGLKRGGPDLIDQFAQAIEGPGAGAAETVAITEDVTLTPVSGTLDAALSAEAALEAAVAAAQAGGTPAPASGAPAEFVEAVMTAQKAEEKFEPKKIEELDTEPPAATAPLINTAPPPSPRKEPEVAADIFGEFSPTGETEEADPFADLGEIDTNRMLDELKDLNVDMGAGAEALEEAPDIDKMAEEAVKLDKKA